MNSKNLQEVYLAVTVNLHNDVLIIQRSKKEQGTGKSVLSWAFPGGKREQNEDGNTAVAREVLEETGYKIIPGKIISEREHPNFPVYIYYVACELEKQSQIIIPTDPEVADIKWVKPHEVSKHFTSDFDPKVKEALEKLA